MSGTLLLEQPAPQHVTGGVWDYISPSRLNCWLKCPRLFQLRYLEGLRTPATASLFLGKMVHFGLEAWNRHRMLGMTLSPEEVAKQIIDGWDAAVADESVTFAKETDEMALKKQAIDLVTAYLVQVDPSEPSPQAVEARMETPLVNPLTGEDLGIPLLGIVDLVQGDGDSNGEVKGPTVIDFKTSARSSPPLEITHEVQLTCYSYLFRQLSGQQESGLEIRSLIKTKVPKIEYHRFAARTDAHYRRLFAVLREYLDALDHGRFNYRPGWSCNMCDFSKSDCRNWPG